MTDKKPAPTIYEEKLEDDLGINNELDLTEIEAPPVEITSRPDTKPYNPEPHREVMRSTLAITLVLLLAMLIGLASYALIWGKIPIADIKSFLELIFTPLVALVGSAIGFYYGGKNAG